MNEYARNNLRLLIVFASFLLLVGCSSPPPDLQNMLQNLSSSYPAIWRLTTAAAYVGGFLLALKAVYTLKIYGEQRTMMSSHASIKGPAIYFLVSSALIFSPTMFHNFMLTTFGYANTEPLSYIQHLKGWSGAATKALLGLVQVFGAIAFIRGWFIIARTAEGQAQSNAFGKGITHIIGGVAAVNIVGTKDIIWNTFGFGG